MKNLTLIVMLAFVCLCQSQTKINGFANINGNLSASDQMQSLNTDFEMGEFDLFVTSNINKVYFLSELVVEFEDHEFGVDMERLILGYKFNDAFQLQGGKVHVPLGYWNNKFHHGLAIQPTISRPKIIGFEDGDDATLPIHQLGVELKGNKISKWNLGYDVLISNGISKSNTKEINKHKAITAKLFSEPIEGLEISVSGMIDKLDSGNVTFRQVEMNRFTNYTVLGAGVSYFNVEKPLELSTEVYYTNANNDIYSDKAFGGFAYLGYKIKKTTLYTLTNLIISDQNTANPFFYNKDVTSLTLGSRYQVDDLVVLKFEYTNNFNLPDRMHELKVQFALGF